MGRQSNMINTCRYITPLYEILTLHPFLLFPLFLLEFFFYSNWNSSRHFPNLIFIYYDKNTFQDGLLVILHHELISTSMLLDKWCPTNLSSVWRNCVGVGHSGKHKLGQNQEEKQEEVYHLCESVAIQFSYRNGTTSHNRSMMAVIPIRVSMQTWTELP